MQIKQWTIRQKVNLGTDRMAFQFKSEGPLSQRFSLAADCPLSLDDLLFSLALKSLTFWDRDHFYLHPPTSRPLKPHSILRINYRSEIKLKVQKSNRAFLLTYSLSMIVYHSNSLTCVYRKKNNLTLWKKDLDYLNVWRRTYQDFGRFQKIESIRIEFWVPSLQVVSTRNFRVETFNKISYFKS